MKKLFVTCLACCTSLFAITASAAPGEYWEITTKTEMPGMPFAMPATTQKLCVGKGKENDPRQSSQDKECQMTDIKVSGNKTSWKMRCNRNGEVMTGTGEQTTTRDSYQGTMHVAGKSGGQNIDMTSHYSGKRIGGSCDTEELARQAQKQVDQQIAQTCDTSGRSTADLINLGDTYLAKGAVCADKRDAVCSAVRRDADSDVDAFVALSRHDKHLGSGNVSISKACGVNLAATTKTMCKKLDGSNYKKLSPYCPAEAKAYRAALRKKQCAGRSYTSDPRISKADQDAAFKKCMSGDDSPDDAASSDAADSDSKSSSSKSDLSNPANAAIEGAKKLKGLFGF